MIIRYTKKKDHIPKGRLVKVTAEKGKEEIDGKFAEEATEAEYQAYQDKRNRGYNYEQESNELRDMYAEAFGKEAPKTWDNNKIASKLDEAADNALKDKIEEVIKEKEGK